MYIHGCMRACVSLRVGIYANHFFLFLWKVDCVRSTVAAATPLKGL